MKLLMAFICLSIGSSCYSQDTLVYNNVYKSVTLDSVEQSLDDLFVLMRPQPKTFELIESARDCYFYGRILGVVGGFPLGFSIGSFLITQKMNWIVFGAGAGMLTGGVLLGFRGDKKLKQAVYSYNSHLNSRALNSHSWELDLGFNTNGFGLSFRF